MPNKYEAMVVATKRVSVLTHPDSGRKRPKGLEVWEVETDGLGNFETKVEISATINHVKDPDRRQERVRALVIKETLPRIKEAALAHSG